MSDTYTVADARADGKRIFRWRDSLSGVAFIGVFFFARARLALPSVEGSERLLWFLLPIPLLLWFAWGMIANERRQDEVARRISQEANSLAAKFAIVLLFFLGLAESAFGVPLVIPGPFGLPAEPFGMFEAGFLVLLFWGVAGVLTTKRYLR